MARLFVRASKHRIDPIGSVSSFNFFHTTGIFTFICWLAFTDHTIADYQYIFDNSTSASENGFQLAWRNDDGLKHFECYLGRTSAQIIKSNSATNTIVNNNWHHVGIAGDGTNMFFIIDGVEATGTGTMGTKGTGDAVRAAALGIGLPSPYYYALGGKVGEVIVLNYRASAAEIARVMYDGPRALSKFPVCYMPLWGVASPEPDLAGLGSGTVTGATVTDHPYSLMRPYSYVPRKRNARPMKTSYGITGVTRDSGGSILGSCTVQLFKASDKSYVAATTSDASTGVYTFSGLPDSSTQYFIRALKDGSPNAFGITDDEIVGAAEAL